MSSISDFKVYAICPHCNYEHLCFIEDDPINSEFYDCINCQGDLKTKCINSVCICQTKPDNEFYQPPG
jgi:hypothetical protein